MAQSIRSEFPLSSGFGWSMMDKTTTACEFDDKASQYESNRMAPWYKAHADIIFEKLCLQPGNILLDIGCGTGYLLRRIAKRYPDVTGIGIDLAPKMVEVARRRAAEEGLSNLTFVHSDWERPNQVVESLLDGQRASYVICANAFHYFADPPLAIKSMHAVLASGGHVYLLERAKEGSLLSHVWDIAHRFLIQDNVRFYDSSTIIRMLENAGFLEANILVKLKKYLWKNKFYTSVALISGTKD